MSVILLTMPVVASHSSTPDAPSGILERGMQIVVTLTWFLLCKGFIAQKIWIVYLG